MFLIELVILAILAFQDFNERQVSVILLLALALYKVVDLTFIHSQHITWLAISSNLLLIGVMTLCTLLYYMLRYSQQVIKKLQKSIGLADLLIVVYFAFSMNSLYFLSFLVSCTIISLFLTIALSFFW